MRTLSLPLLLLVALLAACEPLPVVPPSLARPPVRPVAAAAPAASGATSPAPPPVPVRGGDYFRELPWAGAGSTGSFLGVAALSQGRAVAVGEPGVAWIDEDGIKLAPLPEGTADAVWAEGPDFAVAVGPGGLAWIWNGSAWRVVSTGITTDLTSVWGRPARGSSPRLVFAGGTGTLLELEAGRFIPVAVRGDLVVTGFTGSGEAIFAVGQSASGQPPDGVILRWNGHGFVEVCPELACGSGISAAWASAPNELWTAGHQGELVHYAGGLAELVSPGSKADLKGVWGTGEKDLFLVGDHGTCLHFDGVRWSEACGSPRDLKAIDGLPSGEAWIAGGEGTLLHLRPMEAGTGS